MRINAVGKTGVFFTDKIAIFLYDPFHVPLGHMIHLPVNNGIKQRCIRWRVRFMVMQDIVPDLCRTFFAHNNRPVFLAFPMYND